MKQFTKNNVVAWMLVLITAVCAFLGIILTTPQVNTAYADAEQITQETFPDTSTWKEKEFTSIVSNDADWLKNNFAGKFFRFYYYNEEKDINYDLLILGTKDGADWENTIFSTGGGEIFCLGEDSPYGIVYYKDYGTYIDFIYYPPDTMYFTSFKVSDDEGFMESIPENCFYELSDATIEELPAEDKGAWDNFKDWFNVRNENIAEYISENTGLTITGSIVGTVIIGAVVYFIFFRKKR